MTALSHDVSCAVRAHGHQQPCAHQCQPTENADQIYPRTSRPLRFSLVQVRQQGDGLLEYSYHDYTEESNLAALHDYLDRLLLKHSICGTRITIQGKLELFLAAIYKHQDYPPNCSTLTNIEDLVGLSCFGFDLLTLFAQFGFVSSVQWLLENSRMNVNAQDSRGVEPLMAACRGGHLSVMKLLYDNFHADPRLYTADRPTLLMVACQVYLTRREPRLSNIVKWLLNDVRVDVDEEDENGMTALHTAISHSDRSWMHRAVINGTLIDELHEAREGSIHVNEEDNDGWTPLHFACMLGHRDEVEMLLTSGADIHLRDNDHQTPADIAYRFGHRVIAKLLEPKRNEREWQLSEFPFFVSMISSHLP